MLVARTLWYLESHMAGEVTLEGAAADLGVSPFHLSRAFASRTGLPVMRYVWRRRLARAAERLAAGGGTSVLDAALEAGYGSQEAFTRAFRAEFETTPARVASGGLKTIVTLKPITGEGMMDPKLKAPKLQAMPQKIIAGPSMGYDMQTRVNIPAQWAAYNAAGVGAEGAVPDAWYGVVYNFGEGTMEYLCGQEVRSARGQPKGFSTVVVPAGTYARFRSEGHISTMGDAWNEIYEYWLAKPEYRPRPGPTLEFYPLEFDGRTGNGGYEIWIAMAEA